MAFNWIVGGTDAHAKNFSFLIGARGRAALAPLYDVASTLPYPGRHPPRRKLAMKIGGESRLGYIRVRHWERFAAQVGLPPEEVLGICESVATETPRPLCRFGCGRPVGRTGSPGRREAQEGDHEARERVPGPAAKVRGRMG